MTLSSAELEQRRKAAVKHGAQASLQLAPRAGELCDYLRSIVPVASDSDEPAIALLALVLARVETANAYLHEHGVLDEQGQPQGVLRALTGWENTAGRLLAALGLTPTSRASLGLDLVRAQVAAQSRDLTGLSTKELAELRLLIAKADERAGEDSSR